MRRCVTRRNSAVARSPASTPSHHRCAGPGHLQALPWTSGAGRCSARCEYSILRTWRSLRSRQRIASRSSCVRSARLTSADTQRLQIRCLAVTESSTTSRTRRARRPTSSSRARRSASWSCAGRQPATAYHGEARQPGDRAAACGLLPLGRDRWRCPRSRRAPPPHPQPTYNETPSRATVLIARASPSCAGPAGDHGDDGGGPASVGPALRFARPG